MSENFLQERPPDSSFVCEEYDEPPDERTDWALGDKFNHSSKGPGTVRKVREDGKLEVAFSFGAGVEAVNVGDCRKVSRDDY